MFCDPELTRIVVDKIHELSTAKWRPIWKTVKRLTDRAVQFLFLSGSVRFGHESRLLAELEIKVNIPVVRSPLSLPVHQLVHLRLGPSRKMPEFLTSIQAKLSQDFMQPADQGIIFYPSPDAVQRWGGAQSCASWNGCKERHKHETEWLEGKHQFIHATTTCSLGIDNGQCNIVIFANFLPGLVTILQSLARGGRRGQRTLVIFVTSHGYQYSASTELHGDPECVVEGAEMLNSKQGCLQSYFGRAFNCKSHTCGTLPNMLKCQRCAPDTLLFLELEQLATPFSHPPAGLSRESSRPTHRYSPYPRATGTSRNPTSRACTILYNPNEPTVETIGLQASIRVAQEAEFVKKLHAIAALSRLLRGHCGACWALTGPLFTNHHPVFGPCSLDRREPSQAFRNTEYRNWVVVFQPLTACFRCYMPQVQHPYNDRDLYNRTRTQHPKTAICTHPNLFKVLAWAVLKTQDLLFAFTTTQPRFFLDPEVTRTEYAKWLATATDGLVNMGHLVYWLIERHKASGAVVS